MYLMPVGLLDHSVIINELNLYKQSGLSRNCVP